MEEGKNNLEGSAKAAAAKRIRESNRWSLSDAVLTGWIRISEMSESGQTVEEQRTLKGLSDQREERDNIDK